MPRKGEFFLYPVIRVQAEDETEATDRVIEAIFTAGVGEIPGWCSPPPSLEERRLQQAAADLLAVLQRVQPYIKTVSRSGNISYDEHDPTLYEDVQEAIAKATNPQAR